MKFLYLADLHFARYHEGELLTGWRWYVDKFGPCAVEALELLDRGVREQWLVEAEPQGDDGRRARFYDIADRDEAASEMPPTFGQLRFWIRQLGHDTNALLSFVYGATEPMVDAESGQYLDFSTARPPVHVEVIQGRPIKGSAKARILAALDKLQASYTADLERNSQMGDGPKDDHYQRDLPVESLQPKGEVILDFGDGDGPPSVA